MNKARVISALLSLFVSLPIWFWLIYQILLRVDASELMFFLFWVYVPVTVFAQLLAELSAGD